MNRPIRLWIFLSAWLAGAGWILSALHALNRTGYLICFAALGLALVAWSREFAIGPGPKVAAAAGRLARRFKRPAPLLFLAMVLLNLIGGLASQPLNFDSNSYRIPRVLHWLGNDGWHWIHTADSRMNIAGCNYEWILAPLILFTHTDRWVFLVNLCGYLFLPGLIFSFLKRLGIHSRVAWWWMWLLASGWCFVLQAGSTLNDSFGALYALAAMDFALRAVKTGNVEDLWFSLLAVGLLVGVKETNLPLLLPWLLAAWPAARFLGRRPAVSVGVIALSLLVSAVPMAWLNWIHTGTWSGFAKLTNEEIWVWGKQQELTSPIWGVIGNLFCLPLQNFLPLFFAKAGAWNGAMEHFVQTPWGAHFTQFEDFGHLSRSINEGSAGIGLGIVVLTFVSVMACRRPATPPARAESRTLDWRFRLIYLAPWAGLLVFMAKVGTYQNARQMAPYYVLLFPPILAGSRQVWLTRRRWWRYLALTVMLVTVAFLGFVRGRAILPASTAVALQEKYAHSRWVSVFADYYSARASVLAQRDFLNDSEAADAPLVGYATTAGAAEPGWWVPFGRRRVERVLAGDPPAKLRADGLRYVVVEDTALKSAGLTIEQWEALYRGDPIKDMAVTRDPGTPFGHLYLVRLRD